MATARTRTGVLPDTMETFVVTNFQGVEQTFGPYAVEYGTKSMDDFIDSGFHARRRAGEVFCNPCYYKVKKFYTIDEANTKASWWYISTPSEKRNVVNGNTSYWFLVRSGLSQLADWDSLCDIPSYDYAQDARQKCLSRVDSTPYEFFEDLAEIRETIKFLRNPVQGLADLGKSFQKKKRGLMKKRKHEAIANLWNQYRFAAAPLIRSVMTGLEALANFDDITRPARRSAHGYADAESNSYRELQRWTGNPLMILSLTHQGARVYDQHASIYYEVSNPMVDWNFALGLRLKDVPKTAWEVIPLSFMFDRLYNVKRAVMGLTNLADPALTILSGAERTKTTDYSNWSVNGFWWESTFEGSLSNPDSFEYETFVYDRKPWSPTVHDTIPVFTPKNLVKDLTSILDLVAITISLWK